MNRQASTAQLGPAPRHAFLTVEQVLLGGDVALAQGRWRGLSAGPGGERLEQRWRASAVLRLVGERWCLHILSPWQLHAGGSG